MKLLVARFSNQATELVASSPLGKNPTALQAGVIAFHHSAFSLSSMNYSSVVPSFTKSPLTQFLNHSVGPRTTLLHSARTTTTSLLRPTSFKNCLVRPLVIDRLCLTSFVNDSMFRGYCTHSSYSDSYDSEQNMNRNRKLK